MGQSPWRRRRTGPAAFGSEIFGRGAVRTRKSHFDAARQGGRLTVPRMPGNEGESVPAQGHGHSQNISNCSRAVSWKGLYRTVLKWHWAGLVFIVRVAGGLG